MKLVVFKGKEVSSFHASPRMARPRAAHQRCSSARIWLGAWIPRASNGAARPTGRLRDLPRAASTSGRDAPKPVSSRQDIRAPLFRVAKWRRQARISCASNSASDLRNLRISTACPTDCWWRLAMVVESIPFSWPEEAFSRRGLRESSLRATKLC